MILNQTSLFQYVWRTRKHECAVCKEPLMEPRYEYFAHVLGKGAFPACKLRPKNIELMCGDHHAQFDQDEWKQDPEFAGILKKFELLERQYHWFTNNAIRVRARILLIFKSL